MNHKWKISSLQSITELNKWLLVCMVSLSIICLMLVATVLNKEERWVILPSNDIDNKMEISNQKLYPSYLKSWAIHIVKEVFTTSPEEVVNQHAQIRRISTTNKELTKFFATQLAFVQGNNASSVFYLKSASPISGGVKVTGTLHYWFGGSNEKIALEKSYIVSYKEAARGLILLSNIEESTDLGNENK